MSPERGTEDFLRDILEHAEKAIEFMEGLSSVEELESDERTLFAVVRALEVIGEAAKRIPETVRAKHAAVPWRGMTGMRDKVIHEYFGVDAEVVWNTVRQELPPLCEAIARMLKELEADTGQT